MAIAQGRCLVGVDTSQTEFNTVGKTGGEKTHKLTVSEMPSHRHDGRTANGWNTLDWGYKFEYTNTAAWNGDGTYLAGGDQPHNNLQPYYTCYIFKRTA